MMAVPPQDPIGDAVTGFGDALIELFESLTKPAKPFRRPTKAWRDLTPAYKHRMRRKGLSSRNWDTARGAQLRAKARGHGATPEHPNRVARNPDKYTDYTRRRDELAARVQAKKLRYFGTSVHYRPSNSDRNVLTPPAGEGELSRSKAYKFLKMTEDEAYAMASKTSIAIHRGDHSYDDWSFLFYH